VPHGKAAETIPAREAFDLIHDYPRRPEWDIQLLSAYPDDGHTEPAKGATAVCAGKWYFGGIALKTVYVTFDPPKLAAVKMVNSPPLFGSWASSLRHEEVGEDRSRVTYTFHFSAKPRLLGPFLEPLMGLVFRLETRRRLRALKRHFEGRRAVASPV
jgi:hypothetical protein